MAARTKRKKSDPEEGSLEKNDKEEEEKKHFGIVWSDGPDLFPICWADGHEDAQNKVDALTIELEDYIESGEPSEVRSAASTFSTLRWMDRLGSIITSTE